jgi:hypothetical protein
MPNMTTYKPRRGDVVLVRATVRHDVRPGEATFFADVSGVYSSALIKLDDIVSVEKLAFEVGDRVEARGKTGVICAMCGEHVWIDPQGNSKEWPPYTAHIGMLTRLRDVTLDEEAKGVAEEPPATPPAQLGALPVGEAQL